MKLLTALLALFLYVCSFICLAVVGAVNWFWGVLRK